MPSWNDLINQLSKISGRTPEETDQLKAELILCSVADSLKQISIARGNRNVMLYGSAFLQKPDVAPFKLQISNEDINGFMAAMKGMDKSHGWEAGLTLILHTPGGGTNAAETIVEYLHSKFKYIEVIIPTFAMSAGTMISLSANHIIMGRQSQLGPIDPQMAFSGRYTSARAIVDQFEFAAGEIGEQKDKAAIWASILASLGPALLTEAKNALAYGEDMVSRWLERRMFSNLSEGQPSPLLGATETAHAKAEEVAKYFNKSDNHKSHGRRIDREEARAQGLSIEDLERNHRFQDTVLTLYHLMTIYFEKSKCNKMIWSHNGSNWLKQ